MLHHILKGGLVILALLGPLTILLILIAGFKAYFDDKRISNEEEERFRQHFRRLG